MTKDRLASLVAAQSVKDDNEPKYVAVNVECYDGFVGAFFQEVEEIRDMIEKIETNVAKLGTKHSNILTKSDDKTKQEVEDLMAEIEKNSNNVHKKLKVIEQTIQQKEQINKISVDLRIRKTQYSTLSRKFAEVMTHYNRLQTYFRKRCKDRIHRLLEVTDRQTTDEELEKMFEEGTSTVLTQGINTGKQREKQLLVIDIEARHADIMKSENAIRELHDMFVDMAMLVENQGDLVDIIEEHVLRAENLKENQSKAKKKKILIMICLVILIIILIVILSIFIP